MFNNHKNFQTLGTDIFIFKNFLLPEELRTLDEIFLKNLWTNINGRISDTQVEETSFIFDKMEQLVQSVNPEYFINMHNHITKMDVGDFHPVHADCHDYLEVRAKSKTYVPPNPFTLEKNNLYGTVIYLNSFEGGEIYYPEQDVIIKPDAGDLVVHSSDQHCSHGVKLVKSVRFSIPNAIFENIKVPTMLL